MVVTKNLQRNLMGMSDSKKINKSASPATPAPAPAPAKEPEAPQKTEAKPEQVEAKPEPVQAKAEPPAPPPAPAKPKTDNLLVRVNMTVLYPRFAELIEQLVANCRARGADYWAICGERTWEEQAALYAQGRTKPGNIVTNAKPGSSSHNYAIAVDFCFDKDKTREGLQPDWSLEKYKILAEEAKKLGLDSGFYWKFTDAPHVQLNLASVGLRISDLRNAYNAGGKKAVFHLLNKFNW